MSFEVYMGLGTTQRDENRRCCHPRPASREGSTAIRFTLLGCESVTPT
jgi:hypothetical protein